MEIIHTHIQANPPDTSYHWSENDWYTESFLQAKIKRV